MLFNLKKQKECLKSERECAIEQVSASSSRVANHFSQRSNARRWLAHHPIASLTAAAAVGSTAGWYLNRLLHPAPNRERFKNAPGPSQTADTSRSTVLKPLMGAAMTLTANALKTGIISKIASQRSKTVAKEQATRVVNEEVSEAQELG